MDPDRANRLLPMKDDPSNNPEQTNPASLQLPPMSPSPSALTRAKNAFGKTRSYAYTSVHRAGGNEASDGTLNEGRDSVQARELWAPFFLRRPAILSFSAIFFAILWSLVALYIYSLRNQGLEGPGTDGNKYYYVWTYGPSAVFMVLGAFWSQTQYRSMQLMPWALMLQGEQSGPDSIFLDYFSGWIVVSFFRSIRKRHFLVSLCISATLLIYALTVFSTGLFELRVVWLDRPGEFTVTHAFDGANFDPDIVDFRPFITCLGVNTHNLTLPPGTTPSHIFPPFQLGSKSPIDIQTIDETGEYETDLDVFTASVKCTPAKFEIDVENYTLFLEDGGCVANVTQFPSVYFKDRYAHHGLTMKLLECGGDGHVPPGNMPDYWDTDWRMWAIFAKRPSLMVIGSEPLDTLNFTTLSCKTEYAMERGPVRIGRRDGENAISASIDPAKLVEIDKMAGVTPAAFTYATYRSVASMYTTAYDTDQRFLYPSNKTLKDIWASHELASIIENSTTCTALQVARNHLLVPLEKPAEGIVRKIENRLFVRQLSFGFMVGIVGILLLITGLLLWLYIPVAVCPRDTGSIGGMATIFAQNSTFMSTFSGLGTKWHSEMHALLSGKKFSSGIATDGRFIVQMSGEMDSSMDTTQRKSEVRWWSPISSKVTMRIFTILAPLALIAALEALYRHSHDSGAIGLVEGKSQYIRYVWVYIPALTMFGVRLFYQSMEFGARIVQPYYRLRQGGASPETSVLENQNRNVGIYALFDTLRKKQWALVAATFSLFLASALPIVVSGLYVVEGSNQSVPTSIKQLTRWNLGEPEIDLSDTGMYHTKGGSDTGYQEDMLPSMILYLNLSYPTWTYDDLAFPEFSIPPSAGLLNDTRGLLEARLPALRGKVDCKETSITDGCDVYWIQGEGLNDGLRVNCTELEKCDIHELASEKKEKDVYFSTGTEGFGGANSTCPTHVFLFGQWIEAGKSADMTLLKCDSWIEEVDVDVRLQLPSYEFDSGQPPTVVPGSERKIFNGYLTDKGKSKPFPRLDSINRYLLNIANPDLDNNTIGLTEIAQAAIYGIDGIPVKELFYSPEKLADSLNRVLSIVVAQLLNSWAHEPFENEIDPKSIIYPQSRDAPVFEASFHDRRDYLVQSAVSTRILEGLLGGMVVCAIITMSLMRTNRVLPKDPCTIAATASLLHNSKMLGRDIIPEGAEWCDDQELKKRGVFQGRTFTMGWWDEGVRRRRTVKKRDMTNYSRRLDNVGLGDDREGLLDGVVKELDRRGSGFGTPRSDSIDSGWNNDGDLSNTRVINERDTKPDDGDGRFKSGKVGSKVEEEEVEEVVYDKRFGIDVDID